MGEGGEERELSFTLFPHYIIDPLPYDKCYKFTTGFTIQILYKKCPIN